MAKVNETKKYADYVYEMKGPVGLPPDPASLRQVVLADAAVMPSSPWHFEVFTWLRTGSAYVPGKPAIDMPFFDEQKKYPIIEQAFGLQPEGMYPMYHTYDEAFLFFGTDPDDPTYLGGEIEFWLGAGEHAEKWVINKSTYIYVPAGMVHCPLDCVKFEKPFHEIVFVPRPRHEEFHINLWPPGYKAPFK